MKMINPNLIIIFLLFKSMIGGCGIGMTVGRVLRHHNFLTDPHSSAMEVWEQSGFVTLR